MDSLGSAITVTANRHYQALTVIPTPCTITGIRYRVAGTSNGNVRSGLFNAAGTQIAARTTNLAQAAINTFQDVAFDSPVAVEPGVYWRTLIFSSSTATALQVFRHVPDGFTTLGGFAIPATITVTTVPGNAVGPAMTTY